MDPRKWTKSQIYKIEADFRIQISFHKWVYLQKWMEAQLRGDPLRRMTCRPGTSKRCATLGRCASTRSYRTSSTSPWRKYWRFCQTTSGTFSAPEITVFLTKWGLFLIDNYVATPVVNWFEAGRALQFLLLTLLPLDGWGVGGRTSPSWLPHL